ncbi:MAG: amino-acid N-acetyltransferase [Thioalkalivibrionaceae bacterium]
MPYIAAHRDRTIVLALGGEAAEGPLFESLLTEIVELSALGLHIVLVHGARPQISTRLAERGLPERFHRGLRVTDAPALDAVCDAIGRLRLDIESGLSRSIGSQRGLRHRVRVAGGNFVTAQPIGVRDGVDFGYTGIVRRVDVDGLRRLLDDDRIVVASSLGFSPTGERFNLSAESVATRIAIELCADKLIFLTTTRALAAVPFDELGDDLISASRHSAASSGATRSAPSPTQSPASTVQSGRRPSQLTVAQVQRLLASSRSRQPSDDLPEPRAASASPQASDAETHDADAITTSDRPPGCALPEELVAHLDSALDALAERDMRVHLVDREIPNALLRELFTREGAGTLISREAIERLRPATIEDVPGIAALIAPLEAEGVLVPRSRERIELEIEHYRVLELDGLIVGTAALFPFPESSTAELACLALHRDYRGAGRGDRLLEALSTEARTAGCDALFVLTTHTGHWFQERGFRIADACDLPPSRRERLNLARNSRILVLPLISS